MRKGAMIGRPNERADEPSGQRARKRIRSGLTCAEPRPAARNVEERVVLGLGSRGDTDALTSERSHDDVLRQARLREVQASLSQRQPDEVRLRGRDVVAAAEKR